MNISADSERIFNAIKEGVLIADKEGKIVYFNSSYSEYIGEKLDDVRGKRVEEIRPGARIHEVIEKGRELEQIYRKANGKEYFVNIYPLFEDKEVIGGISIVTFLENAKFLAQRIGEIEEREAYLDARMKELNGTRFNFDSIVRASKVTEDFIERVKKVAHSDISVLLSGESGSGKELYAQAIHNESPRKNYPFIAVNCALLSGNLLESELFGYEGGAFTGAQRRGKAGIFEIAKGGTIFLDEISEMDYAVQAKLLRALQERKIRRVGGTKEIDVDVRIIGACNVNLMSYIESNRFRRDLYYRIAAVPLHLEPLRERREDVNPLIDAELKELAVQGKKNITISEKARDLLNSYNWPGNVRELKNVLGYAALMCRGSIIEVEDLPETVRSGSARDLNYTGDGFESKSLADRVRSFEQREISKGLELYGNTLEGKKKLAKAMGISLATLYNKMGK